MIEEKKECDCCKHGKVMFEGAGCGDWAHERYCLLHGRLRSKHYVCPDFEYNGEVA